MVLFLLPIDERSRRTIDDRNFPATVAESAALAA
jgi:hypothetical protein